MKKILSLALACVFLAIQGSPLALAANGKITHTKNINSAITDGQLIENDIIRMQKDFVNWSKDILEMASKEGIKENGNMEFGVKSNSKDLSSEFNVKVTDYKSTTNFLKNTAEVSGKIEATVSSSGSKFDYTKPLNTNKKNSLYTDDFNAGYEKIPVNLNAKIALDINLAIDKKYAYFTISTPIVSITGTDKEVKEVEDMIDGLNNYTGKTFKIAIDNSGDFSLLSGRDKLQEVLEILEKQSLLEPKKQNSDGSYQLEFKKTTLQSMNIAMGRKKNADINEMKSTGGFIVYKKENEKTLIRIAQKPINTGKNYILLENTGSNYIMSGKFSEKNNSKYNKSTTQTDFRFAKNSATLNSSTKSQWNNQWNNSKMNMKWDGNNFSMKMTENSEYSGKTSTEIKGTMNLDSKTIDLKIKNNDTEVAIIQGSPENTGYKYNVTFNFDMFGTTMDMFIKGYQMYEYGNFDVKIPENAELLTSDKLGNLNF